MNSASNLVAEISAGKTIWAFEPQSGAGVARIAVEISGKGYAVVVDETTVDQCRKIERAIARARFLEADLARAQEAKARGQEQGFKPYVAACGSRIAV